MPDDPSRPDPLLDAPSWVPSWLPTADDGVRLQHFRWIVIAVFVAGLGACVLRGADSPADPELEPALSSTTTTTTIGPEVGDGEASALAERFGTVTADLVAAGGDLFELCLLDADTTGERAQGLMGVEDIGGYDGMLFRNDIDSQGAFYMYRTLIPLTVAWWTVDGGFVGASDMTPCPSENSDECELYPPPGPYRFGLEVLEGSPLRAVFEPGARLEVRGGACEPAPA